MHAKFSLLCPSRLEKRQKMKEDFYHCGAYYLWNGFISLLFLFLEEEIFLVRDIGRDVFRLTDQTIALGCNPEGIIFFHNLSS